MRAWSRSPTQLRRPLSQKAQVLVGQGRPALGHGKFWWTVWGLCGGCRGSPQAQPGGQRRAERAHEAQVPEEHLRTYSPSAPLGRCCRRPEGASAPS